MGDDLSRSSGAGAFEALDATLFGDRLAKASPRARAALQVLYGDCADATAQRLADAARAGRAVRSVELRMHDLRCAADPTWFQRPDQVGYVAYCEQFGTTLRGVEAHADYLAELQVTYLHLMRVIANRPEPNDGGFAVRDYCDVDTHLGTVDDLVHLAAALRSRGIRLCLDFVMNHTAREHPWAEAARAGDAHHRAYYHVFADRTLPDRYEEALPEVFPEMAPGNFTWDDALQGWVWTTFNTYQWDLNYANPDVLLEMLEAMLRLANMGVDVLRLDAVAFTWKRMGTNCQNQAEAHLIAQLLRAYVEVAAPGVLLKAEAIVGPRELTAYLGAHETQRHECHIAYHNQLMVMVWSALASRDVLLLRQAMANLPQTPSHAGWATYVRCHDDIGWAVDDADAAQSSIDGRAHRRFLADFYRGDFPGTFARGASFSVNEETGDERTCGTTASLCGIEAALADGDDVALDRAIRRLVLAYAIVTSFGMPLIYMGDEIGLLNDLSYLDDPATADDSRWMHRPVMDWQRAGRRHQQGTVEARIFSRLQQLLRARRGTDPLHQGGTVRYLWTDDRVFAFVREHPEHGTLLGVANVSDDHVSLPRDLCHRAGLSERPTVVYGGDDLQLTDHEVRIAPLSMLWLTDDHGVRAVPS